MSEITVAFEHPSLGIIARCDLSEIQEKAYRQGRADREKELSELPNEYSEKLWKIARDRGYEQGKSDAIEPIKAILEEGYTMMWGEIKTLGKIREHLKGEENE